MSYSAATPLVLLLPVGTKYSRFEPNYDHLPYVRSALAEKVSHTRMHSVQIRTLQKRDVVPTIPLFLPLEKEVNS